MFNLNRLIVIAKSLFISDKAKRKIYRKNHKEIIRMGKWAKKVDFEYPVNIGDDMNIVVKGCKIGRYSYLQNGYILSKISVGRYCSFACNVFIVAKNHPLNFLSTHPLAYTDLFFEHIDEYKDIDYKKEYLKNLEPIPSDEFEMTIGNDVWIGANVTLLGKIEIGNGAVVGAGSVVTKNVPPYAIVAGNPAKIIRYRFDEETIRELEILKWYELDLVQIKHLNFSDIKSCIKDLKKIRNIP